MHVVHVEQECSGDDRTALATVLQVLFLTCRLRFRSQSKSLNPSLKSQADGEREWLLSTEKMLVDEVPCCFGEVESTLEMDARMRSCNTVQEIEEEAAGITLNEVLAQMPRRVSAVMAVLFASPPKGSSYCELRVSDAP